MAYIKIQPRTQIKTSRDIAPITLDGGVNRYGTVFNIASNEAWDCRNTTSKIPGVLSVKPTDVIEFSKRIGASNSFSIDKRILGAYVDKKDDYQRIILLVQDPDYDRCSIVYWNDTIDTWKEYPIKTSKDCSILTFATDTLRYIIVANGDGVYETHDETTYTLLTDAPKTPLYTYDDYRLFALKGNVLSWCDPDDITNWSTGDAGQQTLSNMDKGTAIITLNDNVFCFSSKSFCILYGDDTDNYQVSTIMNYGCVGFRAIATYKNSIYFLDFDGLKVYTSGEVLPVSDKIDYWIKRMHIEPYLIDTHYNLASISIERDFLYLSIPIDKQGEINYNKFINNITFELNLKTGVVNIWDDGYIGIGISKNLYLGIKHTGIYEMLKDSAHTNEWYHITGMRRSQFNKQTISSIPVLLTLPTGSTLKVAYNTNDMSPSWTDLYTFTPSNITQEVIINVPMTVLNNNMMYQLKFYGTGPCVIHEIGSDGRVIIR